MTFLTLFVIAACPQSAILLSERFPPLASLCEAGRASENDVQLALLMNLLVTQETQ